MQSIEHKQHISSRVSHMRCPECRADNSRRFAGAKPFSHLSVPTVERHKYLAYVKARLDAIRTKTNGGNTVEARQWLKYEFLRALNNRINSHIPGNGRKHAPDYAKYHLATYGNDWHYLND